MLEDFKQNIENQLSTHRKYLTSEQISVIENIYKMNSNPLLTYQEFNNILPTFGFNLTNNVFEYQEE